MWTLHNFTCGQRIASSRPLQSWGKPETLAKLYACSSFSGVLVNQCCICPHYSEKSCICPHYSGEVVYAHSLLSVVKPPHPPHPGSGSTGSFIEVTTFASQDLLSCGPAHHTLPIQLTPPYLKTSQMMMIDSTSEPFKKILWSLMLTSILRCSGVELNIFVTYLKKCVETLREHFQADLANGDDDV